MTFSSCEVDFELITLVYKSEPGIAKANLRTKNNRLKAYKS